MFPKKNILVMAFLTLFCSSINAAHSNTPIPKWVEEQVSELENYLISCNASKNLDCAELVVQLRIKSAHPMVKTAALLLAASLVKNNRCVDVAQKEALLVQKKNEEISVKLAALVVIQALNSRDVKPESKQAFAEDMQLEEDCERQFQEYKRRKEEQPDQKPGCIQQ